MFFIATFILVALVGVVSYALNVFIAISVLCCTSCVLPLGCVMSLGLVHLSIHEVYSDQKKGKSSTRALTSYHSSNQVLIGYNVRLDKSHLSYKTTTINIVDN